MNARDAAAAQPLGSPGAGDPLADYPVQRERSLTVATRRSLFTAGIATTAALALPAVDLAHAPSELADLWSQYQPAIDADSLTDEDTNEGAATWERIMHIERTVLAGPIRTHADAAAKLEVVALMFEAGQRSDGAEEIAVVQVVAWLKART